MNGYPLDGNTFDGNTVYCFAGNHTSIYLLKIDTENGNILWKTDLMTMSTIPAIAGITEDQVIVLTNGTKLLSIDSGTGRALWSFDVGASINSPSVYGDRLLFGAGNGNLYALNTSSGGLLWMSKVDSQNLMASVDNDRVTLGTYPILVDSESSRLYWSFGVTHQLGTNSCDKHDTLDGTVCCLDVDTGDVLWDRTYQDNGMLYGPQVGMVVNKGTIYLTENTALWIFNAANGNLIDFQNYDHYVLPPVKSGNQVFVAANLQLTAYQ